MDPDLSTEEARLGERWTDGLEFRVLLIPAAALWMKEDTKDEGADAVTASMEGLLPGILSELVNDVGLNKLLVEEEAPVRAARDESILYACVEGSWTVSVT